MVQISDLMWESWQLLTDGQRFTVQNTDRLYVVVSCVYKTTCHEITYTVLKATLKLKINKHKATSVCLTSVFKVLHSVRSLMFGPEYRKCFETKMGSTFDQVGIVILDFLDNSGIFKALQSSCLS